MISVSRGAGCRAGCGRNIFFGAIRGSKRTVSSEYISEGGCQCIPGIGLCRAVTDYLWEGNFIGAWVHQASVMLLWALEQCRPFPPFV